MAKKQKRKKTKAAPTAGCITHTLIRNVPALFEGCNANAIFVYPDAIGEQPLPIPDGLRDKVWYITKTETEAANQIARGEKHISVPDVPLSRMGQIKMAMFMALSRGAIKEGDIVVCLAGISGTGTLDTVIVMEVGRESEIFNQSETAENLPEGLNPEVLERAVDLTSELGSEGGEGKPVGAIFVLGDADRVQELSRQLILNPFRGYAENERNILDPNLEETIKEMCTLDGAFIIRGDGVIVTCGAFLKTASHNDAELPRGLGARHHAAAAITSVTDAVSITVSESTGNVTVFRNGKILTEIEKPRAAELAAGQS